MIDEKKRKAFAELNIAFATRQAIVPAEKDEVDFTIVIAHRGPAMGLWATIHSCEVELADKPYKYNYVLVPNGEKKWLDADRVWLFLAKTGKLRDNIVVERPLSPPSARNLGAESANGKYIFFFDNHCLVSKGYFDHAIVTMAARGADLVHSLTRFYEGEQDHWHYKLTLEKNFWGGSTLTPRTEPLYTEPYRCAVAGHGGFAVKRSVWQEMRGYWDGFVGYGGEECYFDLAMWQHGKTVWLDPNMIHYHWAGQRGYSRHYTDEYYCNMLMCANIIGGSEWMMKVFNNFLRSVRSKSDKTMFDLMMDAEARSRTKAAQFAASRTKSLDNLLDWFRTNNIPY